MKVNAAKAKMLAGSTAFGFELGFGSPLIAEALSRTGIDYLQIDTQHGDWGPDSTLAALVAMEGGTATPMARVARNDYTLIGRLLDEGMMGIIVPMVHTAEDAKAAADACRFPPTRHALVRLGSRRADRSRLLGLDRRASAADGPDREHHRRRECRGDPLDPRRRWLLDRPGRPRLLDGNPPARSAVGRSPRAARSSGSWRRARTPARSRASPR